MSVATETGVQPVERRSRLRRWRDVGTLMKELWTAQPLAALTSLVVLVIGNARTGIWPVAMGGVVDSLIHGQAQGRPVYFWLGPYVFASIMEEFYWTAKNHANSYLLDQGMYRIQRRVLESASRAPLIQFEQGRFFELLQRAKNALGEQLQYSAMGVIDFLQILIMLASIAAALFLVQPILLPLLVVGIIPSVWLQARVANAVYRVQQRHAAPDRIRNALQRLLTEREGAAEIKVFGSASYLIGRWWRLRDDRTRDIIGADRRRAVSGTVGGFISGAAYSAALVLVAYLILRGQLSIGNYVTVAAGALSFEQILMMFITFIRSFEEDTQFLGDVFDFWRLAGTEDVASDSRDRVSLERAGRVRSSGNGMIVEAEGLSFGYPEAPRPVLRDIDLRIGAGEKVAIVGENGAGKTTLVKLLIGLYQPNSGVVRLDGERLEPGKAVEARKRIAAVFQDYATFHLSARDNIGFGDLARERDDARLEDAARRADIAEFIRNLPEGFDSYLGREFGDTDLSGGQWQRVALARAFFRDADLLVLDEPTAALDPLAELALFERFSALAEGRTALMISHRLGMARLADRVIVLQEGEIVEEGSHDELVARGGVYARMFAAQAQWYR